MAVVVCAEFLDINCRKSQILRLLKVSRLKHEFQARYLYRWIHLEHTRIAVAFARWNFLLVLEL